MLKVLYEDNQIIVVEKLPNIPSQADKTNDIDCLTLVKNYVKEKYNKPGDVYIGLVHRLDRPVGGIMVFARTSKSASRLSEQIRNKEFKKKYLAVVDGKFEKSKGHLEDYLFKDERNNISKVVNKEKKNSKLAILDYEVLNYDDKRDLSLVKIDLHTGRHHQIRVQMANAGHSLYGDQKYGNRGKNKQIRLWAYEVEFVHPVKRERIVFRDYPDWTMCKTVGLINE
jgi:23S rRNA pseudouridine1911/1915/1917 synthase